MGILLTILSTCPMILNDSPMIVAGIAKSAHPLKEIMISKQKTRMKKLKGFFIIILFRLHQKIRFVNIPGDG